MPIPKKISNAGTPNLVDSLLVKMLISSKADEIKRAMVRLNSLEYLISG